MMLQVTFSAPAGASFPTARIVATSAVFSSYITPPPDAQLSGIFSFCHA